MTSVPSAGTQAGYRAIYGMGLSTPTPLQLAQLAGARLMARGVVGAGDELLNSLVNFLIRPGAG